MECPKCNAKYKSKQKFCPKCGYVFESHDIEMFSDIYNLDYLKIYYPDKAPLIYTQRVSLKFLFLGYNYAIYKKMYKMSFYTILMLTISLLIAFYFEELVFMSLGFIFYLIYFIVLGGLLLFIYNVFNFDRLLLENRKMRINKIIAKNKDKSEEELKKIFIKDSEGNKVLSIISFIITILWLLVAIYFFAKKYL